MLVLKVGFPQTGSSIPVLEHGTKFAARLSEDAVSRAGTEHTHLSETAGIPVVSVSTSGEQKGHMKGVGLGLEQS